MSTVSILRRLWRHRLLVAITMVVAVVVGTAVLYKLPGFQTRKYDVGIVTAHILVDTPSSQIVQVSPRGTQTLPQQTLLLASLVVDGTIKAAIAHEAGLPPAKLVGVNNAVTEPGAAGPSPVVAPSGPNAWVITTQVMTDSAGNTLPIIALQAQAPTSAGAEKLTNATISALRTYLNSRASAEDVSQTNRLQVGELGTSQATTQTMGPSASLALIVWLLVLVFGCGLILGLPVLRRAWRAAALREMEEAEDYADYAQPTGQAPTGAGAVLPSVDHTFFDFGIEFGKLGTDDAEDDATSARTHAT